jgi:predicted deacylase
MNQLEKHATDGSAEAAVARPGSIHVHVTRVTDENRERQARSAEVEVIETSVADIAAVLMQRGIAADEPVTIVIEWVEDSRVIHLSPADQRAFVDSVLNPPEPTPALQRAAALYRAIMRNSG